MGRYERPCLELRQLNTQEWVLFSVGRVVWMQSSVSLSDSPENRLRELTCPRLNSVVKRAREATVAAEGHNGFSPRLHISSPVFLSMMMSGLGLQVEVFELRRPISASDQKRRSRSPATSSSGNKSVWSFLITLLDLVNTGHARSYQLPSGLCRLDAAPERPGTLQLLLILFPRWKWVKRQRWGGGLSRSTAGERAALLWLAQFLSASVDDDRWDEGNMFIPVP